MKISELPPDIRALAEANRAEDTVQPGNQNDELQSAFQWDGSPEGPDFWLKWFEAEAPKATTSPALSTIPSPETLRPLLEAALAIVHPEDPARSETCACINVPADRRPYFAISLYQFGLNRRAFGSGETPEKALDAFRSNYQPPATTETRIAELEAELAKLKGGQL